MNMTSVIKITVRGYVFAVFLSALAADYYFPSEGGDLASESGWGGTLPGTSDKAIVNKDGTYTLSHNVSFGRFNVETGLCLFDFVGYKMTLSSDTGLLAGKDNGRSIFDGGMLDFSSTAKCYPLFKANDAGTVFTNDCIVTNVVDFYATRYSNRSRVEVAGGARVYTTNFRLVSDTGTDNTLEIYDGGQMHVSGAAYTDANGTLGEYGGHTLRVRGEGSLFRYMKSGGEVAVGFQRTCNTIHVVDGGAIDFADNAALLLGGWNYSAARTNNALVVESSATANIPKVQSNTDANRVFVGDGATLTAAKLRLNSSMNVVIVSNATFNCMAPQNSTDASKEGFNLATSATCTGNVFRIIGPDANLGVLPWPTYWFNGSHHNMFSLEDGAKWGEASQFDALFKAEQHCTFRVTGAGTVFGDGEGRSNRFYIGNKNADVTTTCASNIVEVSGGAAFNASGIWMSGVDNAFVVSNGTVDVKYMNLGFLMNDSSLAANCMLRLCGTSPKVYVRGGGYCRIANNSILRFEIPKTGYADNHVPLELSCELNFDNSCSIEIDCEEFANGTYGTITLIQSSSDISPEVRNRLLSNVRGLPPRSSLIIIGNKVKLRCSRGTIIKII